MALEEKGAPVPSAPRPPADAQDLTVLASLQTQVHWVEAKEAAEPLSDPPAWVVPLDEKPSPALESEKLKFKSEQEAREKKPNDLRGEKEFKSVTSVLKVDPDKKEREERVFDEPETASPWGGRIWDLSPTCFWKKDGIGTPLNWERRRHFMARKWASLNLKRKKR